MFDKDFSARFNEYVQENESKIKQDPLDKKDDFMNDLKSNVVNNEKND